VPAGNGDEVEIAGELAEVFAGAAEDEAEELLAPTAAHPHKITLRTNAASRKPKPCHFCAAVSRIFLGSLDGCRRLSVYTSRAPSEARVLG
jgi:hypothetical protein